jgi:hypothetical protein
MPFDNTLVVVELTAEEIQTHMPDAEIKQPKDLYSVITNSYAGDRIRERFGLPSERVHPIATGWREPILDYVQKHGHLNPNTKEK